MNYREYALAILAVVIGPILGFLGGWIALRRGGITAANVAEITDRAAFRSNLMQRQKELETLVTEGMARERALIGITLKNGASMVQMQDELNDSRARIEELEAHNGLPRLIKPPE